MKLRFLAAPVIAAGIVLGSTGTAFASDTSTTTPPARAELSTAQSARLKVACARIPNIITRTENLQKRLPGDANTKGSIAWVEAKADKAEAAGRVDVAVSLNNRASVMKAKEATLSTQLANLHKAQDFCAKHGA